VLRIEQGRTRFGFADLDLDGEDAAGGHQDRKYAEYRQRARAFAGDADRADDLVAQDAELVRGLFRLGHQQQQQGHHQQHREDHGEGPEAGVVAQLDVDRRGAERDHQDADRIDDDGQRAGTEKVVEGIARRLFRIEGDRQFAVIAFHQLDAVGHGARRDEEGDHQIQRIEVPLQQ
jgi:hypothetical protein